MTDRAPPSDGLSKPFTVQQWEIVEGLNRGESTKAIAFALGVSESTVETQIDRAALRLSSDLTRDLKPRVALVVWRRWVEWLELPRPSVRKTAS